VPRLLRLVYRTHRAYTVGILALRAIRSLIPLAVLWVGKLIIDEVVRGIGVARSARASGVDWWRLGGLVTLELGIAVGGEALARLSSLLESLLGDLFANRLSVRLMEHAATLDLSQFEDAETYDHLERARRQTVGRIGLFAMLLSTAQDLVTLGSLAAVLLLELPWLLLLLAVAVVPAFLSEAHFAFLGYSLLFQWTPERRLLDYLRYMGASDESAKEVKLFGLSDFLVGRYAGLSEQFYGENKRLAVRRNVVSTLLVSIGTLGYYAAYAVIIYLTVVGQFSIGALTFLAGSFRQSRDPPLPYPPPPTLSLFLTKPYYPGRYVLARILQFQARQESNLQPPVLETGACMKPPIESGPAGWRIPRTRRSELDPASLGRSTGHRVLATAARFPRQRGSRIPRRQRRDLTLNPFPT
jgi:ATP-binding cassette, subfamily B, bacterial